jgi:hypothetical protein
MLPFCASPLEGATWKFRILVFWRNFSKHGVEQHINGRIGLDEVLEFPDDGQEQF